MNLELLLDILSSTAAFLAVLVLVILAHELGHFLTAKASGIKVEEFGIGFPPRALSFQRGETLYSLNYVPLGGFTKMAGEEDPDIPRSLASKNRGIRLLVLGAGSLMNAILPILLFSGAFMIPHNMADEPVIVKEVAIESPAALAGIAAGDAILSLDGKPIDNIGDIHRYIHLNLGSETAIEVRHSSGDTEIFLLVPRWKPPPGEGAIGIGLDIETALAQRTVTRQSYPFWQAIPMGFTECLETFVIFKNEIQKWLIGATEPQIAGPVGIAQMTGEVAKAGISPLMQFAAFISINLALVNMFPIPGLDGGRIIFVLLEWVRRGRRISPRTEGLIHLIGFAFLITVILYFTYFDVLRIINNGSLIP